MPASSSTSRRTASSIVSPGSAKPARHDHMVGAKRARAAEHAALARDHQHDDDRIGARKMLGTLQDGQSRRQPACTTCVGAPQFGQKRCRACQPSSALASASGGRCCGIDQALHRDRAQVGDFQIVARLERLDGLRIETEAEARRAVDAGRGTRSRARRRAHALRPARTAARIASPIGFHARTSSPPIT